MKFESMSYDEMRRVLMMEPEHLYLAPKHLTEAICDYPSTRERILALAEEASELASACLRLERALAKDEDNDELVDNVVEEMAHVYICARMMEADGVTIDSIQEWIEEKNPAKYPFNFSGIRMEIACSLFDPTKKYPHKDGASYPGEGERMCMLYDMADLVKRMTKRNAPSDQILDVLLHSRVVDKCLWPYGCNWIKSAEDHHIYAYETIYEEELHKEEKKEDVKND